MIADLIANHISSRSPQFLDYLAKGSKSAFDGMFLTFESVFPQGATERDLLAIYRPRPTLPFTPMVLGDGSRRLLWTTFTAEQIDLDLRHRRGREYLERILGIFAAGGVSMVRLDAIGYSVKAAGRNCFMMPETFELIGELSARAESLGLGVLVEIHSHYQRQIEIARQVDWVYDFALPPLVLHAFFTKTARLLKQWIEIRPHNAVTVLDTHDGIGVIDIGADTENPVEYPGLVSPAELAALVERIHESSRGESLRATGTAAGNLDLYQVNCTFYDALGRDDLKYLLCRAIQFFLPGVPQVYYVGLLAGGNDMELLAETHVGRDINRHRYTREEIDRELERPVVKRLFELIRLRNSHPAFQGRFEMAPGSDGVLDLRWRNGEHFARFRLDIESLEHTLEF